MAKIVKLSSNIREQVFLDDLAEAKATNQHDHGDCYRRPKHETLAKFLMSIVVID